MTKTPMPSPANYAEGEPFLYPGHPQNVIVLPVYHRPSHSLHRRFGPLRRAIACSAAVSLFAAALYFLWPSEPELKLVRLRLNHVRAHTYPRIALDLSLSLTLKVRNRDIYSLDYESLIASIGYRGRTLGFVKSQGGHLRPGGSTYVEATLDLDGLEIVHDVIYLLEDLATGLVPFDTVTTIDGKIGLFSLKVPLKARASCEVYVDINNGTISRQNCYPESLEHKEHADEMGSS